MSDGTKIEWTDATWNVVNGCDVVSPGCTNCYAMRLAGTRLQHHPSRAGLTREVNGNPVWTGEVRFNDKVLLDPLRWKRPRKIFVCAHGDLFHAKVPDEWLDRIFAVMALCPQHIFQVLTKRPERMRAWFDRYDAAHDDNCADFVGQALDRMRPNAVALDRWKTAHDHLCRDWPLPNVWLGVSAEDQKRADERIPILLDTPAAVRWISAEPLLGPIDLSKLEIDHQLLPPKATRDDAWAAEPLTGRLAPIIRTGPTEWMLDGGGHGWSRLDWVVAGGESGPCARPMHPDWAGSLRDQCAAAEVPFLFKQWGNWAETYSPDRDGPTHCVRPDGSTLEIFSGMSWPSGGVGMRNVGKKLAGRHLDGQLHDGFPA